MSDETDAYGNPIDGDRLIYCCYPDCGCDGARLCMAENGASACAMEVNLEGHINVVAALVTRKDQK